MCVCVCVCVCVCGLISRKVNHLCKLVQCLLHQLKWEHQCSPSQYPLLSLRHNGNSGGTTIQSVMVVESCPHQRPYQENLGSELMYCSVDE